MVRRKVGKACDWKVQLPIVFDSDCLIDSAPELRPAFPCFTQCGV